MEIILKLLYVTIAAIVMLSLAILFIKWNVIFLIITLAATILLLLVLVAVFGPDIAE